MPGPIPNNHTDRLRMLNTPRPIAVQADSRGYLVAVRLPKDPKERDGLRAEPTRVIAVQDRWRIDDEWWRKEISRMYFAVVLAGGRQDMLFQDLTTGRWYLQTTATPVAKAELLDVLAPTVPSNAASNGWWESSSIESSREVTG